MMSLTRADNLWVQTCYLESMSGFALQCTSDTIIIKLGEYLKNSKNSRKSCTTKTTKETRQYKKTNKMEGSRH